MKYIRYGVCGLFGLLLFCGAAIAADDTVILTPGSGVTMKSKDVGAGKQAMQPVISDITGTPVGTQANPLYGGGFGVAPSVVPTIQAAAYVSGNAVGALQTVSLFRSAAQPSGTFNKLMIAWKVATAPTVTFFIFDTLPAGTNCSGGATCCSDRVAFNLATADLPKLAMPPFTLTPTAPPVGTTTVSAISQFGSVTVRNQDTAPTQNLYFCSVLGGSITPATVSDYVFKPSLTQD